MHENKTICTDNDFYYNRMENEASPLITTAFKLVGITSTFGTLAVKIPNLYIYTSIAPYVPWITSVMKLHL